MLGLFKFKDIPDLKKLTKVMRELHSEEERVNKRLAKEDFTYVYDSIIVKLKLITIGLSHTATELQGFEMSFLTNKPNPANSDSDNANNLLFTINKNPNQTIPMMVKGSQVFSKIEEDKVLNSIDFARFLKFMEKQVLEIKNNKTKVVSDPVSVIAEKIRILRNADTLREQPEAVAKAVFRKN